jgi:hypothetical protein
MFIGFNAGKMSSTCPIKLASVLRHFHNISVIHSVIAKCHGAIEIARAAITRYVTLSVN